MIRCVARDERRLTFVRPGNRTPISTSAAGDLPLSWEDTRQAQAEAGIARDGGAEHPHGRSGSCDD